MVGVGAGLYLPARSAQFRKLRRAAAAATATTAGSKRSGLIPPVKYLQLLTEWQASATLGAGPSASQPTLGRVLDEARREGIVLFDGRLPDDPDPMTEDLITFREVDEAQSAIVQTDLELFCGSLQTGASPGTQSQDTSSYKRTLG